MRIKKTASFEPAPSGTFMARITTLADLGLQESSWQGVTRSRHMLGITFELSGKKTTGGQPYAIFDTATLSLHEKSRLSEIVRAALGAVPNDLDLAELLGKAVLVTVVHRESKGKVWANVGTVTATPEGLPTPDTETPLLMFDLESPDPTVFGKLPALYRKLIENRVQPPSPLGAGEDTSLDDDIPF